MQYRIDQKSGNKLSALGFGFMRVPSSATGRIDLDQTEALLLQAIDAGINYIDTAYLYRGNEEALGAIFTRNPGLRERLFLADKLPHLLCENFHDFERYFAIQKTRLTTSNIDYYLIHNVTDFEQWQRLVDLGIETWISTKKASGEIGQIGFSFHGAEGEFMRLIDAFDWDFCQIQYNYLNEHYQAGVAGLIRAGEKGIPVIVMEPLLGGKLAGDLPHQAEELIAANNTTPVALALRWVWNHPQVTLLLSGMNSVEQITENVELAKTALPETLGAHELATLEKVRDVFSASYKIACTGCNYCMPCPKEINIPACFTAYNASFAHDRLEGIRQYVLGVGALSDNPHLASDCIQCGACARHCPQHLDIPADLQQVRKRLQPFFFPLALKIGKKVMGH